MELQIDRGPAILSPSDIASLSSIGAARGLALSMEPEGGSPTGLAAGLWFEDQLVTVPLAS